MSERRPAGQVDRAPPLTPRQREVLDLLARNRTNREIAEELGISLDGAKWHVSEILGRLGVDSREDAANYWRHEQGLPVRIVRFLKGFIPGSTAARMITGSAVAGLAVGLGLAFFAMQSDREREIPGTLDGQAGPDPTLLPGQLATFTPTVSPTANEKELEGTRLALIPTRTLIPQSVGACPPGIAEEVCDFAREIEATRGAGWDAIPVLLVPFECAKDGGPPAPMPPLCEDKAEGETEFGLSFGVKMWTFNDAPTFARNLDQFASNATLVSVGCPRYGANGVFDCSSELSLTYESRPLNWVVLFAVRSEGDWVVTGALAGLYVRDFQGEINSASHGNRNFGIKHWLMPWRP